MKQYSALIFLVFFILSCSKYANLSTHRPITSPTPTKKTPIIVPNTPEESVTISPKNTITLLFKAYDVRGFQVNGLQKEDIKVMENGVEIVDYTFSAQTQKLNKQLEMVFAIDITSSMNRYINMIKESITSFVNELASLNIQTKLCLLTFNDIVEKQCDQFVGDHPNTPENENLISFLNDLSEQKAMGGGHIQENSLGGVLSAVENTPWGEGNQHIVFLVTDGPFWVQPSAMDDPEGHNAPFYYDPQQPNLLDTLQAFVASHGLQIFAITKNIPGFSQDYFEYPSIVESTNGDWFDIDRLNTGAITIDHIFAYIKDQMDISYTLEYIVEDHPNLDPLLPLAERKITLSLKDFDNEDITLDIQDIEDAPLFYSFHSK